MASPATRRALAPLDANVHQNYAAPSPVSPKKSSLVTAATATTTPISKQQEQQQQHHATALSTPSPTKAPIAPTVLPVSPPASSAIKKRPLEDDKDMDTVMASPKKICLQDSRPPLATVPSPARSASSIAASSSSFPSASDNNTAALINASQVTNVTEPDTPTAAAAAAAASSLRPRTLTREQSRQKAHILMLRLGLAHYKLRTGQVDVPLEHLRVVPLGRSPPSQAGSQGGLSLSTEASRNAHASARTPLPTAASRRHTASEWVRQQQHQQQNKTAMPPRPWSSWPPQAACGDADEHDDNDDDGCDDASSDDDVLPQQPTRFLQAHHALPHVRSLLETPRSARDQDDHARQDHQRLTSSALRGGAVHGLLSLARS